MALVNSDNRGWMDGMIRTGRQGEDGREGMSARSKRNKRATIDIQIQDYNTQHALSFSSPVPLASHTLLLSIANACQPLRERAGIGLEDTLPEWDRILGLG